LIHFPIILGLLFRKVNPIVATFCRGTFSNQPLPKTTLPVSLANSFLRELIPLQLPGRFTIGCNYWASHAGTSMWRDWRPEVIEADFTRLAASGLEVLRIPPPLWPDFQPIVQLRGQNGTLVQIRLGPDELPLPHDAVGQAGVSAVMLDRFIALCDLAERHGIKLIIGLVTGWMSGRLFFPPALESLNPITDATSIAWQTKLVHAIMRHSRHHPAIQAWDLGNECNCMGAAPTRNAVYLWTAAITNAIRAADATRPVISGIHSIATPTCSVPNSWTIDDQGDLTDLLTTHPYPYWTRHTRNDPINTFRTSLHATAETRFYADIGGKPCFAEEIGTMGPMIAGDRASGDFARINLLSLWANDCRGFRLLRARQTGQARNRFPPHRAGNPRKPRLSSAQPAGPQLRAAPRLARTHRPRAPRRHPLPVAWRRRRPPLQRTGRRRTRHAGQTARTAQRLVPRHARLAPPPLRRRLA
jgi:hypothetical protein